MSNNFYTYAYLREDGTPYYIGKGKNNRLYNKGKRVFLPPKDKSRIIFLKKNLTEEEAFKHEKYMIAVFGRKDLRTGILRNRTDGGEGTCGMILSEQQKKEQSLCRKGKKKSEEHKRKIGKANKGKKLSEEHIQKLKNRIISEQTKQKISESNKGRKCAEETKKKLSKKLKGRIISEETRRKMSEANKRREMKFSEKRNKKISESLKGKKKKEEHKQKILYKLNMRFKCLETGFITTAGALTRYQQKRNIDTKKRIRVP